MFRRVIKKEAAARRSSKMESRDHSNAANPKSLMSRGNIMQRAFLLFAVFWVSVASAFAQDVITLKNGDEIKALVQEIGDVEIKYKKVDNPAGPNYTLKKAEVFMIKYANGSKDVFADNTPQPVTGTTSGGSGIESLNAKELEQVLTEALKLISNFEEVSAELMFVEGANEFFYVWLKSAEGKRALKTLSIFGGGPAWYLNKIAEQKFIELTGLSYDELSPIVEERLGPVRRSLWEVNGNGRLDVKSNLEKFLNTFRKTEELTSAFELSLTEIESSSVMTIPEYYRCSFALETMQRFVKNRRASTWKECVNLYEEQLHRWRMEMNSEESLRIQNDIRNYSRATARNTRATAIFSGLIWLGM